MVEYKDVSSSSPVRTPKLQLAAEQPSSGECWIPTKKRDSPHPKAKEKPPQKKVHLEDSKTRVYLWRIHFDIWQNQYNIVKLKNKIKF